VSPGGRTVVRGGEKEGAHNIYQGGGEDHFTGVYGKVVGGIQRENWGGSRSLKDMPGESHSRGGKFFGMTSMRLMNSEGFFLENVFQKFLPAVSDREKKAS